MNIFEELESLNVSEECFNDLMDIVEEIINELNDSTVQSMFDKRKKRSVQAESEYDGSRESNRNNVLKRRELERAEAAARNRDFRENPEEARNKYSFSPSTATNDELKKLAKSEWKYKQGSVNRWKGTISGNEEKRKEGIKLQAEGRPNSSVLKRTLDRINKKNSK